MEIFAEAANIDYHSSFPNQKKTKFCFSFAENIWKCAVSKFLLQQIHGSCHFPVVLFSIKNITIYHYRYVKNSALVPLTFISWSIGWLLKALTFESVDFWKRWALTFESVDFWKRWLLKALTFESVDFWKRWLLKASTFESIDIWKCWLLKALTFESDIINDQQTKSS